jgi:DDE family transposase
MSRFGAVRKRTNHCALQCAVGREDNPLPIGRMLVEERRQEVTGHLRRLVRRIRRHWPTTRITLRGDSHYARPEVMDFCEQNDIDFVFGLSGNGMLDRAVEIVADDIRTRRALAQAPVLRG